ncbi:MAG TPA: peptide ABC transporter substrate-binding protein, partial [Rubrobacter sp.]|nr:peptide ABC transporter substrate-binding protein [Rubrobacter sp.]
ACASDAGSAEYIVEVFSGLVSFDRDLNVIEDIAESWEVSPDGTVYTFNLRTNVNFHDASRRVTAEDFKFSMERALNPDTQSTVGEVYLDDIVGSDEYITGNAEEVTGIRVVNPDTLEITIKEPSAVFLEKLTYPTGYVVDQREVGDSTCFEGNWTLSPNGTGAFRLTEFEIGESITLEPNPDFYLEPAPSLQKVTYLLSGGSSFTMYENDEVDITGVGINNIESVLDPSNPLNEEYSQAPALDVFYIGFNVEEPPFDNPDVRRALSMAIDKEFLANEFLEGLVVPAPGILPPGMPGYNENLEGIPFDPEGARELLEETGLADEVEGKSVLTSGVGAAPSDILQAVIAMWEENLGVTLEVEQEDSGLFFQDIEQGNFEMTSVGWIADYADPQNFLDIKLHGDSPNNDNFYQNEEVDALLDEARGLQDEERRLQLYQEAEQLIVNDAPWIPLYHGKSSILVKPYVEGYEATPFVIPNLRYVSINQ